MKPENSILSDLAFSAFTAHLFGLARQGFWLCNLLQNPPQKIT